VVCFVTNVEDSPDLGYWVGCQTAVYVIVQILKPAEKKQKFAVTGAGNRPGTPPRAGAKAGVAPAAPAAAPDCRLESISIFSRIRHDGKI